MLKHCEQCGNEFKANKHRRRYCSRRCTGDAKIVPVADRFWLYVDKSGECWNWMSAKTHKGYGIITIRCEPQYLAGRASASVSAHRVAYQLHYGPFDPALHVLHRCDNPSCVRPDHLFLGTDKDNAVDKVQKGRHRYGPETTSMSDRCRGEKHGLTHFTWPQVREIRQRYADGATSHGRLAREYGVAASTIRNIIKGNTWKE
jgi:hypothetical protein